jgi:two-component system OmpR family response regulator
MWRETASSAGYIRMLARPKSRIRVLIADGDPRTREVLARFLSEHGVSAGQTAGGEELLRNLERDRYDLVLLDIMFSGEGGISLCRKVRAVSAIPIILLSATREETDCIVGLEVGADDYLAKPINPREVLARIRAILRRTALMVDPIPHSSCFSFDGWTMDLGRRTLSDPIGRSIELTSHEFDLLAIFVQRPQAVLSRAQLLDLLHGRVSSQFDRSVDAQVSRLRQKIEANPQSPRIIRTMRNEGYIFAIAVKRISQ